jgi:hypothetical protein
MSLEEPTAHHPIVERVKAILTKPELTWAVIEGEPTTIAELYRGYVIPLTAIGPVCSVVGHILFGSGRNFGRFGGASGPILGAFVGWLLTLAGVYVFALIVDWLAPRFGGASSRVQAFKLGAYAGTAGWVAGVFQLFPPLAILTGLAGFYGLYLLYLGLPRLMSAPQDKALTYTFCAVVAAILVWILVGALVGLALAPFAILSAILP